MTEYVNICFNPFDIKGRIKTNSTISEAAQQLNVPLRSECGGKGTCGKCKVRVDASHALTPKTATENKVLGDDPTPDIRLGCQARVIDDLTVMVPEDAIAPIKALDKGIDGKTTLASPVKTIRNRESNGTPILGVAVDIGTTTIAVYLCDMNSGDILSAQAAVNPQRPHGEDVISRIAAVRENPSMLHTLQHLVVKALNELITACLKTGGYQHDHIHSMTIVGNTTMQHIFSGLDISNLGVSPYLPETVDPVRLLAGELGLRMPDETPVYVFPVISGFLGGDILSALLGDRSFDKTDTTLIIDIGTNGELILTENGRFWATSCATGPALEGAQISCGMRAAPGAVSRVFYVPSPDPRIEFETIGNKKAVGICGSGIIDAMAAMRKAGIIQETGNLKDGLEKSYTFPGASIRITLKDIRQVQLAKSALFVGIESLLEAAGVSRVDRTILTGAFGARFNWENARDIGMIPDSICQHSIESATNLAGSGAVMALLDDQYKQKIETIAREVTFLDLATTPDFITRFSDATRFPEI
ncbi:MAG: DUF4445 domain-containing protein [Desulfobacteraceae bacterium]|nr:MAG: DUF4445 domain-containing protein [Desulfobacteraceae bacterium]